MEPLLTSMGIAGAFLAGVTGSVHCAVMCGPLACVALPKGGRRHAAVAWHVGRVGSYALAGAALGLLGRTALVSLRVDVAPVLPWLMAAGLVMTAFDVARHLPAVPGLSRVAHGLTRLSRSTGPVGRAALLGAATPLLPCGLLYGIFLAALATGSMGGGAAVMAGFALGGVPALAAVQLGAGRLRGHPRAALVLRRVVPLAAAAVLIFRALSTRADVARCG